MSLWPRRAAEMAAIFMVGDGVLGLLQPRRHVELWQDNALGSQRLVAPFRDRPDRRRVYALLQIAGGIALAAGQRKVERIGRGPQASAQDPTGEPNAADDRDHRFA